MADRVKHVFLVTALFAYRYYTQTRHASYWAAISFLFLFSGTLSALLDQVGRAFTVDFLSVYGFVVADPKDVYLSIGVAAILAEALVLQPHAQDLDPRGAQAEMLDFVRFVKRDLSSLWLAVLLERPHEAPIHA